MPKGILPKLVGIPFPVFVERNTEVKSTKPTGVTEALPIRNDSGASCSWLDDVEAAFAEPPLAVVAAGALAGAVASMESGAGEDGWSKVGRVEKAPVEMDAAEDADALTA